jgi:aerobic-type carbon monoxide dehydrogenase small subunit (CoxS/CutS family)
MSIHQITLTINGEVRTGGCSFPDDPAAMLREKLALTGTKNGCKQVSAGLLHGSAGWRAGE